MKYAFPFLLALAACTKHSSPIVAMVTRDTVFLQFKENDTVITWTSVISSDPDSAATGIAYLTQYVPPVSGPGVPPYGCYLRGGPAAEVTTPPEGVEAYLSLQVHIDPTVSVLPTGTFAFYRSSTLDRAGDAAFGGVVWESLLSDTVTITSEQHGFVSGTFSATLLGGPMDSTSVLHITEGVFRNLPYKLHKSN